MASFQQLHQPTGRTIDLEGESYQFFGGTAYLGLLDNPDYVQLYKEGIDRYGLNNGTSRANNVQLGIYNDAEVSMARRFGFEEAALFSSGYLAAQATVGALLRNRKVLYAPAAHPALWAGDQPIAQGSFQQWCAEAISDINQSDDMHIVIVANAMDNLIPCRYDFLPFALHCDPQKHLLFILDDSHGIGIINRDAVSIDLRFAEDRDNIDVLVVASLAKGMGTDAGVVLGGTTYIQQIKEHPIFRGASPPAPAALYALMYGVGIYHEAFKQLHQNIEFFKSLLEKDKELSFISGFPVFTSQDPHLYRFLLHNHILISSFPYPLDISPLLNRIVISSLHEQSDLRYLAETYLLKNQ